MSQPRNTDRRDRQSAQDAFLAIGYQQDMNRRSALKALFGMASAAVLFGGCHNGGLRGPVGVQGDHGRAGERPGEAR